MTKKSINYLYILPFKNGDYFKYGITNRISLVRIDQINRTYGIDIKKSTIYYGDVEKIKYVEKYLKDQFNVTNLDYVNCGCGYTEIRKISDLEEAINIINKFNLPNHKLEDMNFKYKDHVGITSAKINTNQIEIEFPKYQELPPPVKDVYIDDIFN